MKVRIKVNDSEDGSQNRENEVATVLKYENGCFVVLFDAGDISAYFEEEVELVLERDNDD